jgi:hypothetical protein
VARRAHQRLLGGSKVRSKISNCWPRRHVGSVEARVHPGYDQPGRAAPLRRRDHSDWIARPDPRCSATPTTMCRRVYTPAVDSGTPSLGTGFSWWLVCGPGGAALGCGAECRRGGQ